jgi:hypothetical protein
MQRNLVFAFIFFVYGDVIDLSHVNSLSSGSFLRGGYVPIKKLKFFQLKAQRLIQTIGVIVSVREFELRWQEAFPNDDIGRNETTRNKSRIESFLTM